MSKVVGILGGMGPMSTVDLMRRITEMTPARAEREHLRLLVDSRPQIPDRPAALLAGGPSPVPMLQESARLLESWGAELIAVPCNTVHAFWGEIQAAVQVEVLNMVGLVARELARIVPPGSPVGLLATTAAGRVRVFHDRLSDVHVVTPDPDTQEAKVTAAILQVKVEGPVPAARDRLLDAVAALSPRPAALVAGCTEVELALEGAEPGMPVLRPMVLLAGEVVARAWEG